MRIGVLESEQTDNEDAMSNDYVFMAKRGNRCVTVTRGARGQTVLFHSERHNIQLYMLLLTI